MVIHLASESRSFINPRGSPDWSGLTVQAAPGMTLSPPPHYWGEKKTEHQNTQKDDRNGFTLKQFFSFFQVVGFGEQ